MVFAISPLVEEAKTRKGWMAVIALFALGSMIVGAIVGVVFAVVGGVIVEALSAGTTKLVVSTIAYTILGIFAFVYGLDQLGVVKMPSLPGIKAAVPERIRNMGYLPRSFFLGAIIGGGFTIGCPFPTYHAIAGWVAANGNPLFGSIVIGSNGLGRTLPLFLIGTLFLAGMKPQKVVQWIRDKADSVKLINGIGLAIFGSFMIVYWGILLTYRAFL